MDIGEAERFELFDGGGDEAFVVVIDNHRHIAARQLPRRFDRQQAGGDLCGEQRVALCKLRLFAQVDQRDFIARDQRVADLVRGNRHLDLSHRLGTSVFA